MNEDYYHEQNSCYDPNSFGFDQFQPSQYTVNHLIFNARNEILNSQNELLNSQNKLIEQMTSICDMVGQYMQKKEEEKRIAEDQVAKDRYWKIPICYDDDDDEESSIPLKDIIISGLPPPSHKGYRNTIELPDRCNVVPLRSDTIRLVQNECSFHGLRSEDPNQHLKDFLKLVDLLDLDVANKERTRLRLFQFPIRDQARNWLERLPAGSISTREDLATRFLAQFSPSGRTSKLRNDILMFQQHK
ncbi:zinc finger, CCHC-type containing protein, partial [Tanacetum coccineum]